MRDLRLTAGDLLLDEDLVTVSGREEVAQSCGVLLGTNQGEWWLNPSQGLDFAAVQGKATDDEIRDAVTAALLQEPRIETVDAVEITRDPLTRTVAVSFTASASEGAIVSEVMVDAG